MEQDRDPAILSPSDLLPGDILLFQSSRRKKFQKAISKRTHSPYTHAAISLGNDELAEAVIVPPRVRKHSISKYIKETACIGVLRTQLGFDEHRAVRLQEFVKKIISKNIGYDIRAALNFKNAREEYFANQLEIIHKDDLARPADRFMNRAYFCSAFVVACFTHVGIIGESAEAAYPPNVFSPGDLHREATFGWFLGYLVTSAQQIPRADPLRFITSWKDQSEFRWW